MSGLCKFNQGCTTAVAGVLALFYATCELSLGCFFFFLATLIGHIVVDVFVVAKNGVVFAVKSLGCYCRKKVLISVVKGLWTGY